MPRVQWHMAVKSGNYVGLVSATASVEFPFVGNKSRFGNGETEVLCHPFCTPGSFHSPYTSVM